MYGCGTRRTDDQDGEVWGVELPTVLRIDGYRFFFYSNEGNEPPHIHVESRDEAAKFWLDPVDLAESHGFRSHELTRLRDMVLEHRVRFVEAWNDHFGH